MNASIGNTIKKYRNMKGYTQAQLAEELQTATSAINAYESGARNPKVELREQIARIFKVDPVEMCGIVLTDVDKRRLLNKLLVEYALDFSADTDDEKTVHTITVTLPADFLPLKEMLDNKLEYIKYAGLEAMVNNDIVEALDCDPSEVGIMEIEDDPNLKTVEQELDYWLDSWPEYDYIYQSKLAQKDPYDGGKFSLKSILYNKFRAKFYEFKTHYLDKKTD